MSDCLKVHWCDGDGVLTEAGWEEDLRCGSGPLPAVGGHRGAIAGGAAQGHVSLQRWLPWQRTPRRSRRNWGQNGSVRRGEASSDSRGWARYTLHVQVELGGEVRVVRDDNLTEVASRVGLLGVVDVQGDVTGRHAAGKAHTALKLGAAHTHGAFGVGDDLKRHEKQASLWVSDHIHLQCTKMWMNFFLMLFIASCPKYCHFFKFNKFMYTFLYKEMVELFTQVLNESIYIWL